MIRIEHATYAESVSCTPMWEIADPSGPIENGTTYIVRPSIEPSNSSLSAVRISSGSRQLFVGPASASFLEQMNVRSSTRATSPGSDSARYEFGRLASDSRSKVPSIDERLRKTVVLLRRPVAPVDLVGLGQRGDLLDPRQQASVRRGGHGGKGANGLCHDSLPEPRVADIHPDLTPS